MKAIFFNVGLLVPFWKSINVKRNAKRYLVCIYLFNMSTCVNKFLGDNKRDIKITKDYKKKINNENIPERIKIDQ